MTAPVGNALENLMTRIVSFAALLFVLVGLSAPGQAPKNKVDPKTKTPPAKVEEPKHIADLKKLGVTLDLEGKDIVSAN